jgi:hypothetical protein
MGGLRALCSADQSFFHTVWVAQVSAPLGGRFANAAAGTELPPIAPRVDDARNALVQDLLYSQAVTKLGFVGGVGPVMTEEPPAMSDGSSYQTDGLRAVRVFDRRPVALSRIQLFDWERP